MPMECAGYFVCQCWYPTSQADKEYFSLRRHFPGEHSTGPHSGVSCCCFQKASAGRAYIEPMQQQKLIVNFRLEGYYSCMF